MTNTNETSMTHSDFERLLEVYGSDRTRWPVEARASAGQLVARDLAARRLLSEAEALDRVLERAPLPSLAAESALAERIVAAARRSPRMVRTAKVDAGAAAVAEPGNVIALPRAPAAPRRLARSAFGGAAGVLAASLLLGIFIGNSSLSQSVLPAIEDMTGIRLTPASSTVAQIDLLDEDLL
jgi:hypothetical protein